jgi:hypothetical protein
MAKSGESEGGEDVVCSFIVEEAKTVEAGRGGPEEEVTPSE